ncbi:MAG: entericidin A/B family lipoprotein [Deltaproteobacteria bacterium]|nr:entericidin A/B family lipoprotein [Deltaproteobacteria bacterium]
MKNLFALLMILLLLFVSGCETVRGLGKDVEKAGEWVQEKVN